jgi:hypothetical protein
VKLAEFVLQGDAHSLEFYAVCDEASAADLAAVLALADHHNADVRRAVASTLPALHHRDGLSTDGIVETLIELTTDPDLRVRDWACFGLGQQLHEVDTAELREALVARLDDLDDLDNDTRYEAMRGLARRRDPRVVPYVRRALTRPSGDLHPMEMISAGALCDPDLHDLVLDRVDGWPDSETSQMADVVRRLTDPAGVGDDVLAGVGELYRRRAYGEPDGDAYGWWLLMFEMLAIAPDREAEFRREVCARLEHDPKALNEVRTNSALSQHGSEPP